MNRLKQAFYPHIVLLILENIFSVGFLILIFLNQLEHENISILYLCFVSIHLSVRYNTLETEK